MKLGIVKCTSIQSGLWNQDKRMEFLGPGMLDWSFSLRYQTDDEGCDDDNRKQCKEDLLNPDSPLLVFGQFAGFLTSHFLNLAQDDTTGRGEMSSGIRSSQRSAFSFQLEKCKPSVGKLPPYSYPSQIMVEMNNLE